MRADGSAIARGENLSFPSIQERKTIDFYRNEDGYIVFTENYHLERGVCCGAGCRHCPFEPKAQKGNRIVSQEVSREFGPGKSESV